MRANRRPHALSTSFLAKALARTRAAAEPRAVIPPQPKPNVALRHVHLERSRKTQGATWHHTQPSRRATAAQRRRGMQNKGCSPAVELKATSPTQAQAGGRPVVGVPTAFRRKTSPRPRVFRLPVPVVVGEAGRRAACPELSKGRSFVRGLPSYPTPTPFAACPQCVTLS